MKMSGLYKKDCCCEKKKDKVSSLKKIQPFIFMIYYLIIQEECGEQGKSSLVHQIKCVDREMKWK